MLFLADMSAEKMKVFDGEGNNLKMSKTVLKKLVFVHEEKQNVFFLTAPLIKSIAFIC